MTTIEIQKFATIPYLDLANLNGRTISSLTFHDAGAWRTWVEAGDKLVEIKAWPAESFYFSKIEADPNDIALHFLDFMSQRACFPEVQLAVLGIHDDIFNLASSLAKIEHLHVTRGIIGAGCERMVASEIEYVFLVCRSIFDLLQEIAVKLWAKITLTDASIQKKPLKEGFNKMTQYEGKPVNSDVLASRFGLPLPLANYYVKWQGFFGLLRSFRDNVVHHGSQIQTVFAGEQGFMIAKSLKPFFDLNVWRDSELQPNDIVPLMPALGVVVYKTLAACEEFSQTLATVVQFPPPIAPGMHLFMRGYFNQSFTSILRDAAERLALSASSTQAPTDAKA